MRFTGCITGDVYHACFVQSRSWLLQHAISSALVMHCGLIPAYLLLSIRVILCILQKNPNPGPGLVQKRRG